MTVRICKCLCGKLFTSLSRVESKTKEENSTETIFDMAGVHREAIQKQIHQDWANREYIEVITTSIKRITDFLNSFG